jgi:nucleotidyltransferase/DNA polymerase involved in DNA repair
MAVFKKEQAGIMNDEKVIAVIRLRELDTALANAPDILLSYNKTRNQAKHLINSMTMSVGGHSQGEHQADIIIDLPLDNAEILKDIHYRLEDELDMSVTIGVGDELSDAKLACDWAIKNRPGTIKVMEPAIADETKESSDDDKYDHFEPADVAMDEEGRPVNIKKSEKTQDWADDSEAISPEMRQKVARIVQMLQQKKDYLNQLQQSNPEIYQGVLGVVQSISAMAQSAKEEDAKRHSKMITKISRHLDDAENDNIDDETAKVLEELVEEQKRIEDQKRDKIDMMYNMASKKGREQERQDREHKRNLKTLFTLSDKVRG